MQLRKMPLYPEEREKWEKEEKILDDLFVEADRVYTEFVEDDLTLDELSLDDLEAIVKFICKREC